MYNRARLAAGMESEGGSLFMVTHSQVPALINCIRHRHTTERTLQIRVPDERFCTAFSNESFWKAHARNVQATTWFSSL